MELREYLSRIANTYRMEDGLDTPTQDLLKAAPAHLAEHAPAGIPDSGKRGKGLATYTPWLGFFDPDETDSPQRGMYVVYIFAQDMSRVALTLNQGMEYLRQDQGDAEARRRLANDASIIRTALRPELVEPFSDTIDLRSRGARQKAYEAGNIACRMYQLDSLPSEDGLEADLRLMLSLYEQSVAVKRDLLLSAPGTIASPSGNPTPSGGTPWPTSGPRTTPNTDRYSSAANS
jgi:hypothetical protein